MYTLDFKLDLHKFGDLTNLCADLQIKLINKNFQNHEMFMILFLTVVEL